MNARLHTNGPRDTETRLGALEEASSFHDHELGKVAVLSAHLERNTERLDTLAGEVKGGFVRLELALSALGTKLGAVDGKAELADQKAELADVKATRASFTNEAEPAPNAHPSRAPLERAVADAAGNLAVQAVRGARGSSLVRIAAIVLAALVGGTAIGARLESCTTSVHAP